MTLDLSAPGDVVTTETIERDESDNATSSSVHSTLWIRMTLSVELLS